MKVQQNTTEFQPVTITLESKDELALFTRLFGALPVYVAKKFNLSSDDVFERLSGISGRIECLMLSSKSGITG